jgi:hypothetical protein
MQHVPVLREKLIDRARLAPPGLGEQLFNL